MWISQFWEKWQKEPNNSKVTIWSVCVFSGIYRDKTYYSCVCSLTMPLSYDIGNKVTLSLSFIFSHFLSLSPVSYTGKGCTGFGRAGRSPWRGERAGAVWCVRECTHCKWNNQVWPKIVFFPPKSVCLLLWFSTIQPDSFTHLNINVIIIAHYFVIFVSFESISNSVF